MDIIISILQEELENSQNKLKHYAEKSPILSKAHLQPIIKGKQKYYYLKYRSGSKIKSEYIGKLSKEELQKYNLEIAEAKKEKEIIRKLKNRIKFIEKSLKYKSLAE